MSRIAVVGSLNIDLVVQTPRMPQPGETLTGHKFYTIPGGKGANQAVAAARQGAQVAMIGRVGNDDFGRQQQHGLQQDHVDCSYLGVDPERTTGVALITVDDYGQNSIIVIPGANAGLTPEQIDTARGVIESADMLVCQFETPFEGVAHAIDIAAAQHVPVLLNPAPAMLFDWSLLPKVTYLIPNEHEASFLTGITIHDRTSARHAALELQQRGTPNVIITLGSNGALVANGKDIFHESSIKVNAVDATAAGDAFVASFAAAMTEGRSVRDAVRWATSAAALSVTKLGAQSSLPTRPEIEQFIAQKKV